MPSSELGFLPYYAAKIRALLGQSEAAEMMGDKGLADGYNAIISNLRIAQASEIEKLHPGITKAHEIDLEIGELQSQDPRLASQAVYALYSWIATALGLMKKGATKEGLKAYGETGTFLDTLLDVWKSTLGFAATPYAAILTIAVPIVGYHVAKQVVKVFKFLSKGSGSKIGRLSVPRIESNDLSGEEITESVSSVIKNVITSLSDKLFSKGKIEKAVDMVANDLDIEDVEDDDDDPDKDLEADSPGTTSRPEFGATEHMTYPKLNRMLEDVRMAIGIVESEKQKKILKKKKRCQ